MIIKINACKVKYKLNVGIFVWDCDNLIENKPKYYSNTNF
jgi:hypothetical protein